MLVFHFMKRNLKNRSLYAEVVNQEQKALFLSKKYY